MTATSLPVLPVLVSLALAPIPELGLALQLAGLGAAAGSAVALRARHRNPDVDAWRITTAWATFGLLVGGALALIALVV